MSRARVVKSAVDCETAMRDVGGRRQQPVGDLLEPGRVGQVGVLVNDDGNVPNRGRETSERARAVAVQVHDVGLPAVELLEQRRQRRRVELRAVHVGDVDAQLVERVVRQIALAQADERDR